MPGPGRDERGVGARDDLQRTLLVVGRAVAESALALLAPAQDLAARARRAGVIAPERDLRGVAHAHHVDGRGGPRRLLRAVAELAKVVVPPALHAPAGAPHAGVLAARLHLD